MYTVTFSAGALFGLGAVTGGIITLAILVAIAFAMNKKKK